MLWRSTTYLWIFTLHLLDDRLITEFEKVVRTRESRKEKKKVKNNYIDEMDEENEVPVIIVFAILLVLILLTTPHYAHHFRFTLHSAVFFLLSSSLGHMAMHFITVIIFRLFCIHVANQITSVLRLCFTNNHWFRSIFIY